MKKRFLKVAVASVLSISMLFGSMGIGTDSKEAYAIETTKLDANGEVCYLHMYTDLKFDDKGDWSYADNVTGGSIVAYANGKGTAKTVKIYSDLKASYGYTYTEKTKKVKSSTGKLVVGITTTNKLPALVKNKIVDDEAALTAKATISAGMITVTAQSNPGKVYLWVIDTAAPTTNYACCPITIKAAASSMALYKISHSAPEFARSGTGKTSTYTKDNVNINETLEFYLDPTSKGYKLEGKKKVSNVLVATGSSFIAKSSDDTIATVKQDEKDPLHFIVTGQGLKKSGNKYSKGTASIVITDQYSEKKTSFTVTTLNPVLSMQYGEPTMTKDGVAKAVELSKETKVASSGAIMRSVTMTSGAAIKTTLTTTCQEEGYGASTDSLVISAPMISATGYDYKKFESTGTFTITAGQSWKSPKVTCKLGTDKKTLTITAKNTAKLGDYYFVLRYNSKVYEVLKVTVE